MSKTADESLLQLELTVEQINLMTYTNSNLKQSCEDNAQTIENTLQGLIHFEEMSKKIGNFIDHAKELGAQNSSATDEQAVATHDILNLVTSMMKKLDELRLLGESVKQSSASITSISANTDLLALNATIEAAHAQDYGRGFSVVAADIKNLAKQTASASNSITFSMRKFESATKQVQVEMKNINNLVHSLDDKSSKIQGRTQLLEQNMTDISVDNHAMSDQLTIRLVELKESLLFIAEIDSTLNLTMDQSMSIHHQIEQQVELINQFVEIGQAL